MSPSGAQLRARWAAAPGIRRFAALAVVVATVTAVWSGVSPSAPSAPSAPPGAVPADHLQRVRSDAVRPLLQARARAVAAGDEAGWEATLDDGTAGPGAADPGFRDRERAVLDRVRQLEPTVWREDLVSTAPLDPARDGPGDAFVAHVRLAVRLAGDTRDADRERYLSVVRRPAGWRLAGDAAGPTQRAVWDLGPLTVVRTARALAIGTGDGTSVADTVRRIAQEADAAAGRVDTVWPDRWRRPVVVVVPRNAAEFAAVLDLPPAAAATHLAALTTGELTVPAGGAPAARSLVGGTADRVVVNPAVFGRLTDLGRRVVLTHELTHVATRAVGRTAPPRWVEEGFANWVAYRGSGLTRSEIAAEVLPAVRAGTASGALPDDDAFGAAAGSGPGSGPDSGPGSGPGSAGAAYADAWLAFDLMAAEGAGRPLAFYRAAAGLDGATCGAGDLTGCLTNALSRVLGTDRTGFETRWRAWRAEAAA